MAIVEEYTTCSEYFSHINVVKKILLKKCVYVPIFLFEINLQLTKKGGIKTK